MAALGSLVVKLALEHAQYTQALGKSEQDTLAAAKRIQDTMDSVRTSVATTVGSIVGVIAAGLSVNAFKGIISGAIEAGAALDDLATMGNTTVEALSGLASIGKFSDFGAEAIVGSMNKLTKNLSSATEESKGTARAVQALGLNLAEFKQLKPEDQMMAVAQAMDGFQNSAAKSAVAMDLYGKEGAKMLPFLKDLADVSDLQAKVTTEQAAAAANLDDNWTRLTTSGDAWKKTLANAMIPALDIAVQSVLELVNGTGGLRDEVKRLADDGSIKDWTLGAVTGLSYVSDAVEYAWRSLKSLGQWIGAEFAVLGRVLEGDFKGVGTVLSSVAEDIGATWSADTMGAKFRARMTELAGVGAAAKEVKAALTYDNSAAGNKTAAETEYEKLVKKISERLTLSQQELEIGRQLTESEKFRLQVMSQMDAAGVKLDATERASLQTLLDKVEASDRAVISARLRAQSEITASEQALQAAKENAAEQDKVMKAWRDRTVAANEAIQSAKDNNDLVAFEATLVTKTNAERQAAVEIRRIELELAKKIRDIDAMELDQYQKDALKDKAAEWAEISKSVAKNRAALGETDRILASVDSTAQQVWTNIWEGGSDVFTKLGQTIKATILDLLYQMTIRRWVIGITASVMTAITGNTVATAAGSAGLSSLSGLASLGSSAASYFGAGATTAYNAGLGVTAGLGSGSATAAATAAAEAAGMSSAAAASAASWGASIVQAAPYVAAAYLAYQALSSWTSGETRTGGQYAVAFDGQVTNNRRGESYQYVGQQWNRDTSNGVRVTNGEAYLIEADGMGSQEAATRKAVSATANSINETLKALGSSVSLTGFWTGFENSSKGRGGVFTGGSLSNGALFGESGKGTNVGGDLYESTSTRSPDLQTAIANWSLDLKQSTLQALQQVTDIPEWVKAKLKGIDTEALSSDAADALLKSINDQIVAVRGLANLAAALPFSNLKALSFDAASGLLELTGGLDSLNSQLNAYYQAFYSESERQAQTLSMVNKALTEAGLSVPTSREQYKELVKAQDLNTEAGRKNFAILMQLAPAFASVTAAATDTAEASKAAADAALKEAEAKKQAALDAVDTAYAALEKSIAADRKRLDSQRTAVQSVVSELQGVFDLLGSSVRELYASVADSAAMAADRGRQYIASALASGVVPDQAELQQAISAVRADIDNSVYLSAAERDYQRLVLAAQLRALGSVAGNQLSTAEQTLESLDKQIQQLDDTLDYWQKQIDLAKGNVDATLSVADAIKALSDAILGVKKPAATTTSGTTGGKDSSGFSAGPGSGDTFTLTGRDAENSALRQYWDKTFNLGAKASSLQQIASDSAVHHITQARWAEVLGVNTRDMSELFGSVGIPAFEVGTNYIPRNMLAYLHEGEAVVPKPYNPAAGGSAGAGGGVSSDASVAELRALRAELADAKEVLVEINSKTSMQLHLVDMVTEGGNAMRTKAPA